MSASTPAPPPRGNLALGIVMGIIAGTVLVMLAWFALIDPMTAAPSTTASPTPATVVEESPRPEPSVSPSAERSASVAVGSVSPSVAESAGAPPEGIVTELSGSWVTVLDSLPHSSTSPEQALARAAELSHPDHPAIVIDTNAFPKLNHGYYAVVVAGQNSRAESNAVCAAIGIPLGDDCYPRQISD